MADAIPFNRPFVTGQELGYLAEAMSSGKLAGDGAFTKKCGKWLGSMLGTEHILLTQSCSAALELAALLADLKPGDEVIMPSYTFVSTANAFVLRGAVPVFVDVRADTANLDETKIEEAITKKTRVIVPVHYAGVGCEMDAIDAIAKQHQLLVIEDAAQALLASYRGRPLGVCGDMGVFSFHDTKNVISGEGGAIAIRSSEWHERAEIVREKGTNRSRFFRGQVDKYTWVDVGSSFLPSELTAAFLFAQLEQAERITSRRLFLWQKYFEAFQDLEKRGVLRLPVVPEHCKANGHIFYLHLPNIEIRTAFIQYLKERNIGAAFHYVPLHSSPAGKKYGRASGDLGITNRIFDSLVRLPLWPGLETDIDRVIEVSREFLTRQHT